MIPTLIPYGLLQCEKSWFFQDNNTKNHIFHTFGQFSHTLSHRLKLCVIHLNCAKNQLCVAIIHLTIHVLSEMVFVATQECSHIFSHCLKASREPPNYTRNFVPSLNKCLVNYLETIFFISHQPHFFTQYVQLKKRGEKWPKCPICLTGIIRTTHNQNDA